MVCGELSVRLRDQHASVGIQADKSVLITHQDKYYCYYKHKHKFKYKYGDQHVCEKLEYTGRLLCFNKLILATTTTDQHGWNL